MKLAILTVRGKPVNPGISALIFIFFSIVVGVIPFAYHDTAAATFPDEDTLLSFFGEDACQLTSTTVEERNSYACSAFLLESAGLSAATAPLAGAILSVALTIIPLLQFRRVTLGVFLVSLGWGFIRAIFLSVLSKDMLSATVVLICVLAARSSSFGWVWLATATLYGWMVRKYWLLVSAVWIGLWMLRSRLTVFRLVLLILLVYITMALVFQVALGVSLDFARSQVNENREIGAEGSRTIIEAVIASDNPIAQAVNALITYFRLAFPLELLRFGSVGQLAFIAIMPFTYIWMIRTIVKGVKSTDPRMIQAGKVALAPLSFLIVEGIFEPDFGSFARHFAMVSPLIFSAMALVQQAERVQNRRLRRARLQQALAAAAAAAATTTTTPVPQGAQLR